MTLRSHVESNGRSCSCCGAGGKSLFVALGGIQQQVNSGRQFSIDSFGTGEDQVFRNSCWSVGKSKELNAQAGELFIDCSMKSGHEKFVQDGVDMSGNAWETLPYPMIIDSGASASVIPGNGAHT